MCPDRRGPLLGSCSKQQAEEANRTQLEILETCRLVKSTNLDDRVFVREDIGGGRANLWHVTWKQAKKVIALSQAP